MAVSRMSFYSEKLKMNTSINVILPEHPSDAGKVLLLLHGLGEDENAWLNQSRLTDYASQTDITIIMPRVDRSYYTSRVGESQYFEYISEEVLQRCRAWFHLSSKRERTFIAGTSMGGFGALKAGLTHPDQFQGIFPMSAMPDVVRKWRENPERDAWYRSLFGSPDQVRHSINDIAYLITQQQPEQVPFIWQFCGDKDPFYDMNVILSNQIEQQGLPHKFVQAAGGHEWRLWDRAIKQVIEIIDKK